MVDSESGSDYSGVKVKYNRDMADLENILSSVERPGDFYIRSTIEVPMPKIEVDGVGILAFPVLIYQIKQLIEQAERAPYGRGEETIYDVSVRKVWQLPPERILISSASWSTHFGEILSQVRDGLGCLDVAVSAELYKMLVYDEGSFFKAHRDTEKTENMFGTLVVVLPSMHKGGELIICHAGKKVTVDLSNSSVSELTFAAFYADCEHEVLPILEGNRVCLVYNLIQKFDAKSRQKKLVAPMYDDEIERAAELLKSRFSRENAPEKIAYLLEHQYSSAALSFATLKNADSALGKIFCQVTQKAECSIHLAIIHIEESGSASQWNCYSGDADDFDVEDVHESDHYADGWVNVENKSVDFGRIPIHDRELLPRGALDDELPDKVRCTEATGNAGAMFERTYRRAALVIWPVNSYLKVLLPSGVHAVLPHLKDLIRTNIASGSDDYGEINRLVNIIIDESERRESGTDRSEMLSILTELNQYPAFERFFLRIMIPQYDGTENASLVSAIQIVDPDVASAMLCNLVTNNMSKRPDSCVKLLSLMTNEVGAANTKWKKTLEKIATAIVTGLKDVSKASSWMHRGVSLESSTVIELWNDLIALQQYSLQEAAAKELISCPSKLDPKKVLQPALCSLFEMHKEEMHKNTSFIQLWKHTSHFLLSRNEPAPTIPTNWKPWKQDISLSCKCLDCAKLQKFACDPQLQEARFPLDKDRRQHLHNMIDNHNLAMTHGTERLGSPFTLVCTKTYGKFEQQHRYLEDVAAMKLLIPLVPQEMQQTAELRAKLCSI